MLGSGIAFLEATVVNVALPAIGADLDADVAGLQWTINGYLLTLAALILLGGSLGDRYGRRRIFNLGVVWFVGASALCAVAPSIEVLIAARVVQGIGGALLTPGSLAIIEASFHPDDRGRAIGAWSALGGVAAAVGPLVGGWLIEAVSWRAIFLINIPLGAFVVWAANRHVPETRDPTISGRLDFRGSAFASLALAGLTFGLIQAPENGLGSPAVIGAIAVGLASAVAFVRAERRSPAADAAAVDLRLAPVHEREPRHLRRLRGPRRGLLPARRLPPGGARLHADRRRRRLAAGDRADAASSRPERAPLHSESARACRSRSARS